MKHYNRGYTQGVYDMLHIGHLNLINRAKERCDRLVVGVNSDSLVKSYKHKTPVISEVDRREMVANLKSVDEAIVVNTLDKLEIHKYIEFDAIFIGDDWRGSERWLDTERALAQFGIDVVYLPYTKGVSSTLLRGVEKDAVRE